MAFIDTAAGTVAGNAASKSGAKEGKKGGGFKAMPTWEKGAFVVGGVGVVYLGYKWYKNRQSSSSTATSTNIGTATGAASGSGSSGGGYGGGNQGTPWWQGLGATRAHRAGHTGRSRRGDVSRHELTRQLGREHCYSDLKRSHGQSADRCGYPLDLADPGQSHRQSFGHGRLHQHGAGHAHVRQWHYPYLYRHPARSRHARDQYRPGYGLFDQHGQ